MRSWQLKDIESNWRPGVHTLTETPGVLGSEDEPLERDGGLSAAATTKNDTLVCSLMAEMTPKMLDFVASEWTQRARDFH